jgi:RNA polymerase sigma factor (sigma-70 family)
LVAQEGQSGSIPAGDQARRPDWAALYECHRGAMLRVAASRFRLAGRDPDQAQDVVNQVFVEVMSNPPATVSNWESYLVRATSNRVSDHLTAAEARRAFPTGTGADDQADLLDTPAPDDVEDQAIRALRSEQLRHRIREVLAGLPDGERRVLKARLFEEKTNIEVAAQLGVSQARASQLWRSGFGTLWSAVRADPAIGFDDNDEGTTGD